MDTRPLTPAYQKAIDSGETLGAIAGRCNLSEKTVLKASVENLSPKRQQIDWSQG